MSFKMKYDQNSWPLNDELIGKIPSNNREYIDGTHIIAEVPQQCYSHFLWHYGKIVHYGTLESCLDFCVVHGLLCDFITQRFEL
jgi:hypothetical protein